MQRVRITKYLEAKDTLVNKFYGTKCGNSLGGRRCADQLRRRNVNVVGAHELHDHVANIREIRRRSRFGALSAVLALYA